MLFSILPCLACSLHALFSHQHVSAFQRFTRLLSSAAALTTLVLKLHEPWLIILPMSFPGAELPFTTAALLLLPRALVAGAALSASAMRETSSRPQTGSLTDVVAAARVSDSRVGTVRAPSASAYASIHGTRPSKPLLEVLRGEFGPESASETPVDSKPEERGTGYTPSRGGWA